MNTTDPIDLALDPDDDDILIDVDAAWTYGVPAVKQGVQIAVSMFMGEWFANLDDGVPYLKRDGVPDALVILGRKFREARVVAVFRPVITPVPGVKAIDKITATFTAATRSMRVSWTVTTVFGDTFDDTLELENPSG